MIELLVLDFDGVCTYSASELIERGSAQPLAGAVRPEAEGVVASAQNQGIAVAVLSNELSQDWISDVPLLAAVEYVVCCSDNGIYKPDRRAFQRCALLAGVRPKHTVVVDDHPDNVNVAASLGMTAVLFESALEDPWKQVKELLDV